MAHDTFEHLKRWAWIAVAVVSQAAVAQPKPTEQDCLGLIAVLPTMQVPEMKKYYEANPAASGKDLAAELRRLADGGDKTAQFTYGTLLVAGSCVAQDMCAGRKYRELSRGSATDWEGAYPIPPFAKKRYDEASCGK